MVDSFYESNFDPNDRTIARRERRRVSKARRNSQADQIAPDQNIEDTQATNTEATPPNEADGSEINGHA